MRFATIIDNGLPTAVAVDEGQFLRFDLPFDMPPSMLDLAALDPDSLRGMSERVRRQPASAWHPLDEVELGPAVSSPGAIYTIGVNYRDPVNPDVARPERPLVYGKAPTSVIGHNSVV